MKTASEIIIEDVVNGKDVNEALDEIAASIYAGISSGQDEAKFTAMAKDSGKIGDQLYWWLKSKGCNVRLASKIADKIK
jgi:hypothetical protein